MNIVPALAVPTVTPARHLHPLKAKRLGIHTSQEAVVYMRMDCHVCRSEGFTTHSRILISRNDRQIIATLHHVSSELIQLDEVGVSEIAWQRLDLKAGDIVHASHPEPVQSLSALRSRLYGHRFEDSTLQTMISDIVGGQYSDVHLSSFITACAAVPLDEAEVIGLTGAMVDVGERLVWPTSPIMDKHSVGGLPGNRTTPIVVSIVTAHGLTMPKTSSRAITSPAGTADTMETLTAVDLDLPDIRKVVEREGGCVVWGGAVRLSPADDILIRIERALDIDTEGQLIASVLSKKIAAGSSHLVIDMPVGPTAKVRTPQAAEVLSRRLTTIGAHFGLNVRIVCSDGQQPVGRGIGPALEAHDVLAVLQNKPGASSALRERACVLAGALLELGGSSPPGEGQRVAERTIEDGRAWTKFQRICEAQGGMRAPPVARQRHPLLASGAGRVISIDNRRLAQLAKLAGAPDAKAAGFELNVQLGEQVVAGQPLGYVHAETTGELHYALDYAAANPDLMQTQPA